MVPSIVIYAFWEGGGEWMGVRTPRSEELFTAKQFHTLSPCLVHLTGVFEKGRGGWGNWNSSKNRRVMRISPLVEVTDGHDYRGVEGTEDAQHGRIRQSAQILRRSKSPKKKSGQYQRTGHR